MFKNRRWRPRSGFLPPAPSPLLRLTGLLHSGTRRWIAAAVGRYHDSENTLADELTPYFREGQLNLVDRGFFAIYRWLALSAVGAHLLWYGRSGARAVPYQTLETRKDGSELVVMRTSYAMRYRRRKTAGDNTLPRLPDTLAAGLLHRAGPYPQRAHQDHRDPAAHHALGPGPASCRRARRPLRQTVADRAVVSNPVIIGDRAPAGHTRIRTSLPARPSSVPISRAEGLRR